MGHTTDNEQKDSALRIIRFIMNLLTVLLYIDKTDGCSSDRSLGHFCAWQTLRPINFTKMECQGPTIREPYAPICSPLSKNIQLTNTNRSYSIIVVIVIYTQ